MNQTKRLSISLGIFFFIALILTFFSNTLYNHNLPLVTVIMPGKGKLVHRVTANSEISYEDSYKIYSPIEGRIDEIYVSRNQAINKGDAIMKIIPDESKVNNLQQDIIRKENEISLAVLKLNDLYEEKKFIDEAEASNKNMKELNFQRKGEAKLHKDKIENAKEEYEKIKKLYEMGAEPYSKLLAQENLIESLITEYEIYMKDISLQIMELELSINAGKLDLENLKKTMNDYKDNVIYADYSGIINLNKLERKSMISTSSPIGTIAIISDNYICELNIDSKEREKINQDSTVKIRITGISSEIKGEILSIDKIDGTDIFEVKIGIKSEQKLSGQSCKVTIENTSEIYDILVDNAAVRKDSEGYYIFVLKEEKDRLKKKYTIKRVAVELLESDEKYSAIEGLQLLEPVVVRSDKNIYNGNRVKYEEKQ
ncbi:efflux RND transporter periplasmic adaptor subunit [Alkaliphilus crotonatoxidans]